MDLSKPQRISAISGAGTLLAGVGGAVATTDWRIGLYGLLVSVLAAVSGALWPTKPAQPFTTTMTGPAYLERAAAAARKAPDTPWLPPTGSGAEHYTGPSIRLDDPAGLLRKPDDEPPAEPTPVG